MLNEIPSSWEKSSLGKIGKWSGGGTPSKGDASFWTNGTIPWISPKDMKHRFISDAEDYITEEAVKQSSTKLYPASSILVVTRSGILRKEVPVAIATRSVAVNQDIKVLLPNKNIDNLFVANYLWGQNQHILFRCAKDGTTVESIDTTALMGFPIYIPPLPEQQKIAQILSSWDKAIEKLEALIAAKQKRKKALMQQLLTGKKRFAEHVKSDARQKTKFGDIPSDWKYLHIGEVAKQVSQKNNAGHELPVLSCTKHYGLVDSLKYFGKQIFSEDTSTYKIVPRNTFAYATNHIEEGSIGYQNLYDKALISPMYTVFQSQNNVDDAYLYRLLKTELYRHIFEVNTSASVDRRGSLRWNEFANIKIPVPSLAEQQKIAFVLQIADTEIETQQKQLAALKQQKKGLMQQLLTGKIRVKVDKEN